MGKGGVPSRTPSRPSAAVEPTPALSGQISRVSIADLLTTLESRGRPAVVRFTTNAGTAQMWFGNSGLLDAEMGELQGETAVYRVLGFRQGTFEIFHEPVTRPRAIHDLVVTLISKRAKRSARWQDLVGGGPPLDSIPTRKEPPPREPKSDDERAILRAVDGRRSLLEILDESRVDPVVALSILAKLEEDGFFSTGRLSTPRPPPPRPYSSMGSTGHSQGANSDRPSVPPERSGTLSGIPIQSGNPEPSSPSVEWGVESMERQRAQTLMGSVAPDVFDAGRASESPDSGPELEISSSNPPDESGLVEKERRVRDATPAGAITAWEFSTELPREAPAPKLLPPREAPASTAYPSTPPPPSGIELAPPGTLLGKYRALLRLSRGAESSVYLCRPDDFGSVSTLFAAKVYEVRTDRAALDAFLEAARMASGLGHPNIVKVVERGSFDSHPMLVSDYIEGPSLRTLLSRQSKSRPATLIAAILFDALRGLQAVHEFGGSSGVGFGLVHGDLCPRDLLVGLDGTCRVADVAASHGMRASGMPERLAQPEKLAYLSPERIDGQPLDARADVFSAGVILYEALTGVDLFRDSTPEAVKARVLGQVIEPPSQVGLKPPASFDSVCLRALERDPDRRFRNMREMLQALEQATLEHDTLASAYDVAEWTRSTFSRDIELRRLGVLDASRRYRSQRPAATSAPPPPVTVPKNPVPNLEVPSTALARIEPPATALARVVPSQSPPIFDLSRSGEVNIPKKSKLGTIVALAAIGLLGLGVLGILLLRPQAPAAPQQPEVEVGNKYQVPDMPKPIATPIGEASKPEVVTKQPEPVVAPPAPEQAEPAEPEVVERKSGRRAPVAPPRARRGRSNAAAPAQHSAAEPGEVLDGAAPKGEPPATAEPPAAPPPPPTPPPSNGQDYGI